MELAKRMEKVLVQCVEDLEKIRPGLGRIAQLEARFAGRAIRG